MSYANKAVGPRQSLTSPDTIDLPAAAYPDQPCWYAISGANATFEIAFESTADGILSSDGILGPFRLANAPAFVVGGAGDILILVG